jgi:hypothetical protein
VNVSNDTMRAIVAQHSDREVVECVTFTSSRDTLYLVNRATELVRTVDGLIVTFRPFYFRAALASSEADQLPRATILVDATEQTIVDELLALDEQPTMLVEVVPVDAPDRADAAYRFKVLSFDSDGVTDVRLTLGFMSDHLVAQFPTGVFSRSNEGAD